ncbi:DUF4222 domain-containing protein [Escherichia coli]|nr:DUF4222 domain-containing protein [Escherichia coli]
MKVKNSGFTASGPVRPEIHTGDIFFDKYGWMVKVISVEERRITCRREGYIRDHPPASFIADSRKMITVKAVHFFSKSL